MINALIALGAIATFATMLSGSLTIEIIAAVSTFVLLQGDI